MDISLDTNIWIFGITGFDPACEVILAHLDSFSIIVLDQVRTELERNLSSAEMSRFYHLVIKNQATIDLEAVPEELVRAFVQNGLKKGDAVIGAFCEWRGINIFVSDNRDFLRGLAPSHSFEVVAPLAFCSTFGLKL